MFCGQTAFRQCSPHFILGIGWKFFPQFLDAGGLVVRCTLLLKVTDGEIFSQCAGAGDRLYQSQYTLISVVLPIPFAPVSAILLPRSSAMFSGFDKGSP